MFLPKDVSGLSFPEYKGKPGSIINEFRQVDLIIEVPRRDEDSRAQVDGFEADDILATLTTQAVAEGFDVLLLTGDRDAIPVGG